MQLIFKFYYILFILIHMVYAMPRSKRAISTYDLKLWTNSTIPYLIDSSFSDSDQFNLQNVFDVYESETCLNFVKYKPIAHANWLKIENGEICFSEIGMQNTGQQTLILSKSCRQYGMIAHELGHTIGLIHEMMRPDRNQYIRYIEENIQDQAKSGFEIESNHYKLFNTPFDFQSVMMYSPYEFSKNGLPVWMKMNASDTTPIFDIREKDLSFWDIKAINDLYQCGKHCNVSCPPSNFLDKNCTCHNIEAFADRRCKDTSSDSIACRNATETNMCYDKPVLSSILCRKTCGRCFRHGNHGKSFPPEYKCVDINTTKCERNKIDGYCYTDAWTKVYCKKSCNRCRNHSDPGIIEFACKDRHNPDLCEEWAINGQCSSNPGFMKANCAMSCGTCTSNSTTTKLVAPCRNYSPDSYCNAMARENKCSGTTLKVCLGSCGKCGDNYERNEANVTETEIAKNHNQKNKKECKDLISNCEYFANEGHCRTNKASMQYHCSKTCNYCSSKECINEDSDDVCDAVKQRNLCEQHAGFASRCQKTCMLCQEATDNSVVACKDRDSQHICSEIVRRNQCQTDRGQRCKISCNLCNSKLSGGQSTSKPVVSEVTTSCFDEDSDENCRNLKERGFCQSYLNRAVLCRKTCDLCVLPTTTTATPVVCRNVEDDDTCKSWAGSYYCNENKEYMKENCAKACNFCQTSGVTSVPAQISTPEISSQCKNKDSTENCNIWAEQGYCTVYIDYMKTNCPARCGFCISGSTSIPTSPSTTVKVNEICKNTESDENCAAWSSNYCSAAHISQLCRKACGICQ